MGKQHISLAIFCLLLAIATAPDGVSPANAQQAAPEPAQNPDTPSTVARALPKKFERGNAVLASRTLPLGLWAPPPSIDEAVPPVEADVSCALPQVLEAAGRRVQELVTNLQEFTATERVEHSQVGKDGNLRPPETRNYRYVADIREIRPGTLAVEEYRDGSLLPTSFPGKIATIGLAAFALVFHPYYVGDFDMTCEGLGQWRGQPAWQIRFLQRADKPRRIRSYKIGQETYGVMLKGRAWIAADTDQVVRVETDLAEPVPKIRLESEHLAIEYHPVEFTQHKMQLWLPSSADLYSLFRGRRTYRRHSFRDYLLFSVDVQQTIYDPVVP